MTTKRHKKKKKTPQGKTTQTHRDENVHKKVQIKHKETQNDHKYTQNSSLGFAFIYEG